MNNLLIEIVAKEMDRLGYGHHEHHAGSILHVVRAVLAQEAGKVEPEYIGLKVCVSCCGDFGELKTSSSALLSKAYYVKCASCGAGTSAYDKADPAVKEWNSKSKFSDDTTLYSSPPEPVSPADPAEVERLREGIENQRANHKRLTGEAVKHVDEIHALRSHLADAAQSLETISKLAGRDEFMKDMTDVRGYANSRAGVARGALSANAEAASHDE
ncbi:hypothetical protein D3C86_1111430 [compost metagenome]